MILIVDDQPDIADILDIFLKKQGYDTEMANTGSKALERFKNGKPTLVFLDIKLPDFDGIEVLKGIKKIDPDVPVIMITAFRDSEKVVQAFRLGAYDCIFKPFDFNYIKTSIMSTIGNKK